MGEVKVNRAKPEPPVEEITYGECDSVFVRILAFDRGDNSVCIEFPQGAFFAWLKSEGTSEGTRQTIDELIEALEKAKTVLTEEAS